MNFSLLGLLGGDPKNPNRKDLDRANIFAKEFATRKGLVIGNDAHVGNSIPKFVDNKGKELVGGMNSSLPPRTITNINLIPSYVKNLELDPDTKVPYYLDEQTGDIQYVHPDIARTERFNPNRGKSVEMLAANIFGNRF